MDPTTEGAESRAQTEEPPLGPCANTENGRLQSAPPGDAMIGKDLLTSAKLAESSRRAIERELLLLVEASSTLLASPASSEVLSTIVGLAQQFVSADAHAVWKKEPEREWRRLSSSGLSDSYARTAFSPADDWSPGGAVEIEDVRTHPLMRERIEGYQAEGIASMLIVPLTIHGQISGTVVFYWRTPHKSRPNEVRIATALGNLAAAALGAADLYRQEIESRQRAETSEHRSTFLARAGAVLSASLDYETTLANVAKLAVPGFADWCSVDVLDEQGRIQRVAIHHSDPDKISFAYEFAKKYPPREDDVSRVVLRTGKSVLIPEIPDELVAQRARDPEHLRMIRRLSVSSLIVVPMLLGDETLGIITFVQSESRRRYEDQDLAVAEELARRAAVAISHARLYQHLRDSEVRLRSLLSAEQQARRTAELLNSIGPILLSELDTEKLVQSITDIATELVGADFGALLYSTIGEDSDPSRGFFYSAKDADARPESGEQTRGSLRGAPEAAAVLRGFFYSLSGKSLTRGGSPPHTSPAPRGQVILPCAPGEVAIRVDDITTDPRCTHSEPFVAFSDTRLPARSYLAVPIRSRAGRVFGTLLFGDPKPGAFTAQHEEIVTGIAAQAGIALENARLFHEARQSEDALRRSNEELRRANEDLNQFAYSASHDLQEPLRMVAIYTQMLQRRYHSALDETAQQYLSYALRGAQRMEMLVKDLLAYTQAANVSEGEIQEIDVRAVLEKALLNLSSNITETGAQVSASGLTHRVKVNEVHLLQLFQNLIGNALKYRKPEEPAVIRISSRTDARMLEFAVSDNGIGIPSEYTTQIFGIFKRLHAGDKYPGTGIGLAICQRIVERYGGRIWVESQEGIGSTFFFTLPCGASRVGLR